MLDAYPHRPLLKKKIMADKLYNPDMEHGSPAVSFIPPTVPVTTTQPTAGSGRGGTALGALVGGFMDMANLGISALIAKRQAKRQMEENQRNRDWQEQMYQKYESPTAQAQQMRAAGLNPAGGVSTQSVGSASTSALPTSSPPSIGAGIAQGAQIALALKQAKFEERKQAHVEAIGLREQLRKELETASTIAEKEALINNYREMFDGLKLDNDAKRINNKYLDSLLSKDVELKETQISYTDAQVDFQKAQTAYQELMAKIAAEKKPHEIKVLKEQAQALKAQATQSYANAILASAQAEVAKSSKIKLDNDVKLANNEEARKQAMHLLEVAEQMLINQGLQSEAIKKHFEAERERISQGHVETLNDVGNYVLWTIQSYIPFAPTPHY